RASSCSAAGRSSGRCAARSWPTRPATGRLAALCLLEPTRQQLIDQAGVRLAPRRPHDLADQEAGRLFLASAEVLDDLGVGRDRGLDRRDQGALVADLLEAPPGRDLGGRASLGVEQLEDLAGLGAVETAALDHLE